MDFIFKKGKILFSDKEFTLLDKLVVKFTKLIKFRYVIVSGYLAILFGRSRNTEDIDLLIEKIGIKSLKSLFDSANKAGFYCINAENAEDASYILNEGSSIRFAENNTMEPNFEIKFAKRNTDFYSMDNSLKVLLNKKYQILISPIELQIAYKLELGSEKDYLDAKHLYGVFEEHLDKKLLNEFIKLLGIKKDVVKTVIGGDLD